MDIMDALSTGSAVRKWKQKNVLGPMLWLTAIVCVPTWIMADIFRADVFVCHLLVFVGIAPVAMSLLAYGYFALVTPTLLLSEEHQEEMMKMQLHQSPGQPLPIDVSTRHAIPNPAQPALLSPGELSKGDDDTNVEGKS